MLKVLNGWATRVAVVVALAMPVWALGAIDVRALYRAGEADSSLAETVDSSGNNLHLSASGTPQTALGIAPNSTKSLNFVNLSSIYLRNGFATNATDNFAIEAYLKVDAPESVTPFYNGDSSASGFGMLFYPDFIGSPTFTLHALFGGYTIINSHVPIPIGQTFHFAVVRSGGLVGMYLNGVLINPATYTFGGQNKVFPADRNIASPLIALGRFYGKIDEARIYTFPAPGGGGGGGGGFDPGTLLVNQIVPEATTFAILLALPVLARRPHRSMPSRM